MSVQESHQVVDIAEWELHPELSIYPEGARNKTLLTCPVYPPFDFLISNHRYLFKESIPRHPNQYWSEIIAHRFGEIINVPTPRTFAAYHSKKGISGALIEWFYGFPELGLRQEFRPGGDYMREKIPHYDYEKGAQHNFKDVSEIFSLFFKDKIWQDYWARGIVFDALIANVDRHHNNWGIIYDLPIESGNLLIPRLSPFFDNGTSLGYNILEERLDSANLRKFNANGKHHMRWNIGSPGSMLHLESVRLMSDSFPAVKKTLRDILFFDMSELRCLLESLCQFKIHEPLSVKRAEFVLRLIESRVREYRKILET